MATCRRQVDLPVKVSDAFGLVGSRCTDGPDNVSAFLLPEDGDRFLRLFSRTDLA